MVLSWTRGRVFRRARKGKELSSGSDLEIEIAIPTHFRCPVTLDMMKDPVTVSTGITYDRDSIEKWIESGNRTCPVTKTELNSFEMIPNHSIRRMIQDWCVEHRSYGIERIPTPRIPVTPYEVADTCTRILSAAQNGDENRCVELVRKIKAWGKESERNKRCIVVNGAALALANAFNIFSRGLVEKNVVVLDEILGALTWMRPLSEDGRTVLGSVSSISCMVWFMNGKQLATRQNAALLLKEMRVEALVKCEGVFEALVNMVKEPVGSSSLKACLSTIFKLVNSSVSYRGRTCERLVELGLVSVLLEVLVDAEKGVCEKALGVLDCVCDCKQGLHMAKSNALTLPVVIKKLLRVSELSSSFGVSVLWKVCDKTEEGMLVEALQMGVFHKLLVLLQVGCAEGTKEKATELLKWLNGCRSKAECVDSSLDFKHLKKPF
ncbi:U-box domain-containing protein 20 [Vigna unguiculata]|uniref:U-box domain-containing protein n=1 Tax=Vigna unguiculata TaxID=3917 RepID=A0A4D6MMD4_VIGUN|nr:U-box domain-containing protein 20 [Vigna unguiculata]QCE01147.1 STIP1 homology and U-box containing protein 1 [Vigna unguiculata]